MKEILKKQEELIQLATNKLHELIKANGGFINMISEDICTYGFGFHNDLYETHINGLALKDDCIYIHQTHIADKAPNEDEIKAEYENNLNGFKPLANTIYQTQIVFNIVEDIEEYLKDKEDE